MKALLVSNSTLYRRGYLDHSPHYLDPDPGTTHMGETQEERICQFLEENDRTVIGLREGSFVHCDGRAAVLDGPLPARVFRRGHVPIVAAVGADSEHKWEIDPQLLSRSRIVVDNLDQCARIGDLHHALELGAVTRAAVHADLGAIVAGGKAGRERDDEITLFDSTGIALQDAAAAALVLRRAAEQRLGQRFDFFT